MTTNAVGGKSTKNEVLEYYPSEGMHKKGQNQTDEIRQRHETRNGGQQLAFTKFAVWGIRELPPRKLRNSLETHHRKPLSPGRIYANIRRFFFRRRGQAIFEGYRQGISSVTRLTNLRMGHHVLGGGRMRSILGVVGRAMHIQNK